METQIAKIMRRLNTHRIPVVVEKPAEGSEGEHPKNNAERPKPDRAVSGELIGSVPRLIARAGA